MEHYSHFGKKLKQFLHFVDNSEKIFASCQKNIEALFAFGTKSESFFAIFDTLDTFFAAS